MRTNLGVKTDAEGRASFAFSPYVFLPVQHGHGGVVSHPGGLCEGSRAKVDRGAADDGGYVSGREGHQNVKSANGGFLLTASAS